MKHVAVYVRVSSRKQDTRSQEPDLKRWADVNQNGMPIRWYRDKASGKTMDRPGWRKLEAEIDAGRVQSLICWRLDRIGRTAAGLTALFEKLADRKVSLVSLRDGLDLSTPAGRLLANMLALTPLLANVFLHYVFDLWIEWWRTNRCRGDVIVVRYADDFVMGFQHLSDAQACLEALRQRMAKFGLQLHPDKTRLIEFGRHAAERRQRRGEGRPMTFDFL